MPNKIIASAFAALAFAAISTTAQAQIGYQVSLLNTATGEPRANVTVNAQVTITDSQDNTIYTGSQQATTNDFGVLSLAVGDASLKAKIVDFKESLKKKIVDANAELSKVKFDYKTN